MRPPLYISDQSQLILTQPETPNSLQDILRGIEKEGLRVSSSQPTLARTSHPVKLGSALTNDWVTTDFSEALLEFITPAFNSAHQALSFLAGSHALTSTILEDELIWPASMPCTLPSDNDIPLAQYGKSNLATMKTTYRRGLGHRYGRAMQTVAGIHYNFSLPNSFWKNEANFLNTAFDQQYIDRRYLELIRNFRRYYWLLIYLFGASPCADHSFVAGRSHQLQTSKHGDLFLPYATSLRMGDLGYQSVAQKSLFICYNELSTYIETLSQAMRTPYPPYNIFGLEVGGEFQQLSTALLQIENEFYSPIRPKRVTSAGEKPLDALSNKGIEYIEVRCIDLNPFELLGISQTDTDFIDVFLLTCLMADSPHCDQREFAEVGENQTRVVNSGRQPDLELLLNGEAIKFKDAAKGILDQCLKTAAILDSTHGCTSYTRAVKSQQSKVDNPSLTPSARLLEEISESQQPFVNFVQQIAARNKQEHIASIAEHEGLLGALQDKVKLSLQQQETIEAEDNQRFSEYLTNYFA